MRAPSVTSCSYPCTLVMPAGLPERSLVAKLPSVATSFGWISSICRKRCGSQDAISSGCGSRFPGGRHFRTFDDEDVRPREPDPAEQLVEQLACLPDEGDALLVLVEAGRLADEHQVGVGAPRAEDHLRPPVRERTARARRRLLGVLPKRSCALDRVHRDASLRRHSDATRSAAKGRGSLRPSRSRTSRRSSRRRHRTGR